MLTLRIIAVALILLSTSSCISMLFPGPESQKSKIYHYKEPSTPWQKINSQIDDAGFQNRDSHEVMTINSVCGQYQDQTLEELTKNILVGIDDRTSTEQKEFSVDGLPVMETTITGKSDGQPIKAVFTVIRSQQCVYDIIFASKPDQFDSGVVAYRDLINSFREDRK